MTIDLDLTPDTYVTAKTTTPPEGLVLLRGWIGEGDAEHVRLYLDQDLEEHVMLRKDQIIDRARDTDPYGTSMVWIWEDYLSGLEVVNAGGSAQSTVVRGQLSDLVAADAEVGGFAIQEPSAEGYITTVTIPLVSVSVAMSVTASICRTATMGRK